MGTIEINGIYVNVLAEGIEKFGRVWSEIDEYPTIVIHTRYNAKYSDDWVVIEEQGEFTLYMNNEEGFLVLVELEKRHHEEDKGMVVDRPGRIFYTGF